MIRSPGMDGPEIGKVDDRIAVGVAAAEKSHLHLDAAEVDFRLVAEHQTGRARLLVFQDVLADVAVRDNLDPAGENLAVAADVIGVMVRVEQVLDRLGGDAFHLVQHLGDVHGELVVHEDHAFRGHPHRHVARLVQQAVVERIGTAAVGCAGVEWTSDDVQVVFDFLNPHRLGRQLLLRSGVHGERRENGDEGDREQRTHGELP